MMAFGAVLFQAQVGINTTTPHASAALDIQYGANPKGLLAPRMTTAQRVAITAPAESLLVYDTDLKSFYNYINGAWLELGANTSSRRTNYKLVKSEADLATLLNGDKYVLNSATLYEINGTVTLTKPIDLNNAYVMGADSGDDKLVATGTTNIFEGSTGGSIKGLTLVSMGGKVFNLKGNAAQNLIFRDCIVANSASVGEVSKFGMVFISVVQFSNNTNGIVYDNISQLLVSNAGWFGDNKGTYEKLTGTFGLVQKQGGFMDVRGAAVGFDVSENPVITGYAVLESVVFTGAVTGTGKYVNRYTSGSFANYNFTNAWNVRSPGIPTETDSNAFGASALYYNGVGVGFAVPFTDTPVIQAIRIAAASNNNGMELLRFSTANTSELTYLGKKPRNFEFSGSMSFQAATKGLYRAYLTKNNKIIQSSESFARSIAVNDIVDFSLNGFATLNNGDKIEIYIERRSFETLTGAGNNVVSNLTLTIK